MAKRIARKIDRFRGTVGHAVQLLQRCRETKCPKCGWFLSKFVSRGYNPKNLKQCFNCRTSLHVHGKHIAIGKQ